MGAFISYAIPIIDNRVKAIVAILGSPQWNGFSESPHEKIEKYDKLSLLSLNAGKDIIVSAKHTKEFHLNLQSYYSDYESRFEYIEYPDSGHFMDENDWEKCWKQCLEWLKEKL